MSFKIIKTDNTNDDFIKLITLLDEDLAERYGEKQKEYEKFNKVDFIKDVILIYNEGLAVGCGAIKQYNRKSVELKRVFVLKSCRGQGIAKLVIKSLEDIARDLGYSEMLLETGIKQSEAISLYNKLGFSEIQNYIPYEGNTNSICMKKIL